MVEGMARRFQHPYQQAADLDDVAMRDAWSTLAIFADLSCGASTRQSILLFQFGDAADMVVMMVGNQDIRQRPALALQGLDDGGGFRRIDRGGRLGDGIVDQISEIIGEAGEQANFGGHDISVIQ